MESNPIIILGLMISSWMAPAPEVERSELLNTSNIIQIYLLEDGLIWIDDQPLENIDQISEVVKDKLQKSGIDPGKMKIQFYTDQYTTMDLVQKVHDELKEANILKISYQAKKSSEIEVELNDK